MRKLALASAIAAFAALGSADTLYFVNDANHDLYSINPNTQAVSDIGNMGIDGGNDTFGDLAYDTTNNTMYYSGGRGDENLYTVNLATGAATLVGADNQNDMFAMGYDPANNTMYGATAEGIFGTVNMSSGAFTTINAADGLQNEGLVYNPVLGQMVLSDPTSLYSMNLTTGAATLLSSVTFFNDNGLAYDSSRAVYWNYGYDGDLYEINAASYAIMNTYLPGPDNVSSIAYVPSTPEPVTMAIFGIGAVGLLRRRVKK